eukprot:2498176-Amphidinium_carterae.2
MDQVGGKSFWLATVALARNIDLQASSLEVHNCSSLIKPHQSPTSEKERLAGLVDGNSICKRLAF